MKMNSWKLVISGVVFGMFGAGAPVRATVYHVPSDYSTIQAAYEACQPGDTVIVANGTYVNSNNGGQNDVLRMDKNGSPGAPITVEATNLWGTVLDGQNLLGSDGYGSTVYITGNYNEVRGFKIRNGYYGGVELYSWAANSSGSHNQILLNEVYDNGNFGDTNGANGQDGIYDDQGTEDNSYIGNYIHGNGRISQGLNLDHGMYLCGTNNEMVINNLIVSNCAWGIQVASYNTISNIDIYNNTIVSNLNRGGIVLWEANPGTGIYGADIANNIIYGNADPGVVEDYLTNGAAISLRNNLFLNNAGSSIGSGPWDMTVNGSMALYTATGNITNSDPDFFDAGSNWHLHKCSPAIDKGATIDTVISDFDGLPRPIPPGGAYDIGAYER